MASQYPPKKNTAFTLFFTLYKNDGTVIANPGTITKKVSIDGGAVADIAASVTEEDTTYGQCSLVIASGEMNGDAIWIYIKDDTTGCVPFTCTLYTTANTQDEIGTDVAAVHTHVGTIDTTVANIHDTDLPAVKTDTAAILADTGTDGVLLSSGTGAKQISLSSGAVAVASIANDAITAESIAAGAIDNATFAADVGSTALATNMIAKAAEKAVGVAGASLTAITGVTLAATQTGVTIPTVTTVGTVTDLTNNMAKYGGMVWIDTVNGAAGTVSYTNGIASNPCAALASAKTIADNLKLKRFWVQAGSAITATADYPGYVFDGRGYALTVSGNRNFSSCQIERVEGFSTTGGGITCATGEAIIRDSHLLSLSAGEADFMGCHLNGTVTLTQASVPYLFHGCVGVGSLGKITFAAASQSVVVAKWSGDLTIAGMVAGNTLWLDGNGSVTLDATNSGGTVYIAGSIALTNSGAGQTITDTSRWAEDQSVASVTGAVGSVAANGITATSIAADAINSASVKADAVTKIQNGLATPTNITAGTITTATNVTTVNGLAANVITAASIATDAGAEIADAVWDEALAGHSTAGTSGKKLTDLANADLSGVATATAVTEIHDFLDNEVALILAAVDTEVADIKAQTDNLPQGIKKNTALAKFEFVMTDATTHAPKTGLTVSGSRSIDGGAFAACTNTATITELANGVYWCDLSAADLNGTMITLRYTATGADDTLIHIKTDQ